MECNIPVDKKEFGISIYKKLYETYGYKNYYDISQISKTVEHLGYPKSWECWALVAFMLPANVGEYFRSQGLVLDVVEMKRQLIRAMTNGKQDTLVLPDGFNGEYDVEISQLPHMNLINMFAFSIGYEIGSGLVLDMAGLE